MTLEADPLEILLQNNAEWITLDAPEWSSGPRTNSTPTAGFGRHEYMNTVYFKTGSGVVFLVWHSNLVIYILYIVTTPMNGVPSCPSQKSKAL